MVEQVEEFATDLQVKRFRDMYSLRQRQIGIPESGSGSEVPGCVAYRPAIAHRWGSRKDAGIEPLAQSPVRNGQVMRSHAGGELCLRPGDTLDGPDRYQ